MPATPRAFISAPMGSDDGKAVPEKTASMYDAKHKTVLALFILCAVKRLHRAGRAFLNLSWHCPASFANYDNVKVSAHVVEEGDVFDPTLMAGSAAKTSETYVLGLTSDTKNINFVASEPRLEGDLGPDPLLL